MKKEMRFFGYLLLCMLGIVTITSAGKHDKPAKYNAPKAQTSQPEPSQTESGLPSEKAGKPEIEEQCDVISDKELQELIDLLTCSSDKESSPTSEPSSTVPATSEKGEISSAIAPVAPVPSNGQGNENKASTPVAQGQNESESSQATSSGTLASQPGTKESPVSGIEQSAKAPEAGLQNSGTGAAMGNTGNTTSSPVTAQPSSGMAASNTVENSTPPASPTAPVKPVTPPVPINPGTTQE